MVDLGWKQSIGIQCFCHTLWAANTILVKGRTAMSYKVQFMTWGLFRWLTDEEFCWCPYAHEKLFHLGSRYLVCVVLLFPVKKMKSNETQWWWNEVRRADFDLVWCKRFIKIKVGSSRGFCFLIEESTRCSGERVGVTGDILALTKIWSV